MVNIRVPIEFEECYWRHERAHALANQIQTPRGTTRDIDKHSPELQRDSGKIGINNNILVTWVGTLLLSFQTEL